MTTANPLFNALRVPRQVVIYHHRTELKVDAFSCGLGRDHNRSLIAEILHERGAHIGTTRSRDAIRAFVLFNPSYIDGLGLRVGVRAVEQHDLVGIFARSQKTHEIFLSASGFREHDCLAWAAKLVGLGKSGLKCAQQCLAL